MYFSGSKYAKTLTIECVQEKKTSMFPVIVTNLWIFPISSLLAFRRRRRLRLCTGCFCVVSTICAVVSISYHDISLFVHVCAMSDIPCRTRVTGTYGDVGTSSYNFQADLRGRICSPHKGSFVSESAMRFSNPQNKYS